MFTPRAKRQEMPFEFVMCVSVFRGEYNFKKTLWRNENIIETKKLHDTVNYYVFKNCFLKQMCVAVMNIMYVIQSQICMFTIKL